MSSDISEDFIAKFHALEGVTLGQRKKNFYQLLNQNASLRSNPQALDAISSNLNPATYLEYLLKVELLIYFRRTEDLLQQLKEGNDVVVSKIVKQTWFFKDAFKKLPAEEIVNQVFPSMSYSVRMKVLRKLSKCLPSFKFDSIFDAVRNRYGIYIASKVVTGCSPFKIRQLIVEYPVVKFTSRQLIIMHGKDSDLVDFYFTRSRQTFILYEYYSLLAYIYQNDRAFFNHLKNRYDIFFKLGRRATKKFVVENRDDVIKNPMNYKHIDMRAATRKLGKDSVQLFISALPSKMETCFKMHWFCKSFAPRYHYSLFVKTFQEHYKIQLENHPSLVDAQLLKILPTSERIALAKVMVDAGDDDYIKYLSAKDSIQMLRDKINVTADIHRRALLIKDLIETCHINDDLEALLSVMKYFGDRHKNDDFNVYLQFVQNIELYFGFKDFNEEMWTCLDEMLTFEMLKREQDKAKSALVSFNLGTSGHQKLRYLEFLFKKGEAVDDLIDEYFNGAQQYPKSVDYDAAFVKHFLLVAVELAKKKTAKLECDSQEVRFKANLIQEIDEWNNLHKDQQILFREFPVLLQTFDFIVSNCHYWGAHSHIYKMFTDKIFTLSADSLRDEYLKVFWEYSFFYVKSSHIAWFLKHEPMAIVANLDRTLAYLNDKGSSVYRLWHTLKKFTHLQIDSKAIEQNLAQINSKEHFAFALSVLMKAEDFAALAAEYKPEKRKLDLSSREEMRRYNLQCAIATNFKNTNSYEALPTLFHYCQGDYFKSATRSLYSLMYHTPETLLPEYLDYLSKQAVSVRKHALFLTCELMTLKQVRALIIELNKREKVQSLQKYMFLSTIKYFVKNPLDEFFELVKLNMEFITKEDEESLNSIPEHLKNIPVKYSGPYIQHSWLFLEKTVEQWSKLSPLKRDILNFINRDVARQIDLDFGLRIIGEHFMTESANRDLYNIIPFAFNFVSAQKEKSVIFDRVFSIVDKCQDKKQVINFLRDWYDRILSTKSSSSLEHWQQFVTYYDKKITVLEDFPDFINIFFLKLKILNVGNKDEFVWKILDFFQDVNATYGPYVTHLFAEELETNLKYFTSETLSVHDIYCSMITQRPNPEVAILILRVITECSQLCRLTFNKILEAIKRIDDVGVQINLYCKYRNYLESDNFKLK